MRRSFPSANTPVRWSPPRAPMPLKLGPREPYSYGVHLHSTRSSSREEEDFLSATRPFPSEKMLNQDRQKRRSDTLRPRVSNVSARPGNGPFPPKIRDPS